MRAILDLDDALDGLTFDDLLCLSVLPASDSPKGVEPAAVKTQGISEEKPKKQEEQER